MIKQNKHSGNKYSSFRRIIHEHPRTFRKGPPPPPIPTFSSTHAGIRLFNPQRPKSDQRQFFPNDFEYVIKRKGYENG